MNETVEAASRMRYIAGMKDALAQQYNQPEEDFVEWLGRRVYSGRMTQAVKDKFANLARRAFHEFVNERITSTLKTAQDIAQFQEEEVAPQESDYPVAERRDEPKIITTAEELQAYDIIKDIAQDVVDPERVTLRDSQSYCSVLLDNSNRRSVCRLHFDGKQKYIGLFDGSRHSGGSLVEKRSPVDSLSDIYNHADQIRKTVQQYLES